MMPRYRPNEVGRAHLEIAASFPGEVAWQPGKLVGNNALYPPMAY